MHDKPNGTEIRACNHWLQQELALVDPTFVIALGATAAQALVGHVVPVGKSRGTVTELAGRKFLITVHPSYLLRLPDEDARHREYAVFVADLTLAKESAG